MADNIAILSKTTFCRALALIREQMKIDEQFGDALNLVGNGHFAFGVGNRYLEGLLFVLKEAMDDKYDYISWWLYETDDYRVWEKDDSRMWDLRESEALYDFIIRFCHHP